MTTPKKSHVIFCLYFFMYLFVCKLYQETTSAWPGLVFLYQDHLPKPVYFMGHAVHVTPRMPSCSVKKCITTNILSIHVSQSYSCQFRVQSMSAWLVRNIAKKISLVRGHLLSDVIVKLRATIPLTVHRSKVCSCCRACACEV